MFEDIRWRRDWRSLETHAWAIIRKALRKSGPDARQYFGISAELGRRIEGMDKQQIEEFAASLGDTNSRLFDETPSLLVAAAQVVANELTMDGVSRHLSTRRDDQPEEPWLAEWRTLMPYQILAVRDGLIASFTEARVFFALTNDFAGYLQDMDAGHVRALVEATRARNFIKVRETMGLMCLASAITDGASQDDLLMARMGHAAAIGGPRAGAAL